MSISPTPSTSFSFYPEVDFEEGQVVPPRESEEERAESSSQPAPLKERVYAIADHMGYQFYSAWINLPLTMPTEFAQAECEREKREIFADKPKPFEEIKQRVLNYSEWDLMSWGAQLERKYIELYSDPELRKAKAKEYADREYLPRNEQENEEQWLVLSFCMQELHDLYRKEPKYLDSVSHHLWIINGHNKGVLTRHKRDWDRLTPSEKVEKIFGKRDKYEVVAAATTVGCFFLCHAMYQFWSSHR